LPRNYGHETNNYQRANDYSPLRCQQRCGTSKTIGSIIRGYKIGVTKWFRANTNIYVVWQRNYWEHVIRDENDLDRIREYIANNPYNWKQDELFIESVFV
jgi:putative transposase